MNKERNEVGGGANLDHLRHLTKEKERTNADFNVINGDLLLCKAGARSEKLWGGGVAWKRCALLSFLDLAETLTCERGIRGVV